MNVVCEECQQMYDDARRWTICPHPSLDEPCPGKVVLRDAQFVDPGINVDGSTADRDEEDFLKCAVCSKEHDRYFRENGTTLTWQVVVFNARSEFLSDNSEHGTVCRAGECANKWFAINAPIVADMMKRLYDEKVKAEERNAKILDGKKRGMPGGLRPPND